MRKFFLFLFVFAFIIQVDGYDKKSLVERFTNDGCGPCATLNNAWYNATTQSLINSGSISHIVYNVNWPNGGDPMYLLNSADNMARRTYYGVTWVPWPVVNSIYFDYQTMGSAQFVNTVNAGNAEFAPFNIFITQEALSESLIKVKVKIVRDPTDVTTFGDVRLRVAITEKTVEYSSPRPNGESEFFSVCRKMLPNANGSTFTVPAPGDSVELTLEYVPTAAFLQDVNLDSLRIVAFVQEDPSKVIYQSNMVELIPKYSAQVYQTSPDIIGDNNTPAQFNAVIRNIGVMDDMYYIECNLDGPAGWTGDFTTINGTSPFGQLDSVQVTVGDSTEISVTINPNGFDGSGEATLSFQSKNEPGLVGSVTLSYVTNTGVHLLVVDATGGGYASMVSSALDNFYTGRYGVVSRNALQVPGLDLSYFTMISWSAGNSQPAFYVEEVNNLQNYLDQGGNLLLNGQNVGEDIFDPSGQSQFAQSFFNNYLHSNYVASFGPNFLLRGVSGDPITDGFSINSLTSVYTPSIDEISPFDASATQIITYGTGPKVNSVKADDGNHRVVNFGLGFEQITDPSNLGIVDTLVARSVRWLTEGIVLSNPVDGALVKSYSLDQNYPNPFNPSTMITYSLAEDVKVNLIIYDVMGREVAQLINETQNAGIHYYNFDASDLSSGIYFYKLSAGDFISVKKMTLLK